MKHVSLGLCLACTLLLSRAGFGLEATPAPGTGVSVTLADAIDSEHDGFGRQYQALLTTPIALADGQTIPAGSHASVSLIHNNSGWLTQLTAIVVTGRTYAVSSSAGSIIVPGQQSKPDTDAGLLVRIGLAPAKVLETGRIRLPSSTQLHFRLVGIAVPARQTHVISRRPTSTAGPAPAISRVRTSRISYLCRATDESGRAPNPYYVADVQKAFDNPALVERSWHQYLATTYPYRFANNPHAVVQCTRLADVAGGRGSSTNSESADAIRTPWRYTLGLPAKQ